MDQQLTLTPKLQQIVDVLISKGWLESQITEFLTELSKTSFNKFYLEVTAALTEEDLNLIETMEDDSQAQLKIKELYKLRTGKDPDVEAKEFMDAFAQGFLDEYKKNPNAS